MVTWLNYRHSKHDDKNSLRLEKSCTSLCVKDDLTKRRTLLLAQSCFYRIRGYPSNNKRIVIQAFVSRQTSMLIKLMLTQFFKRINLGKTRQKQSSTRLGISNLRRCQLLFAASAIIIASTPFILTYLGYGSRTSVFYPLFGVLTAVFVQLLNSNSQRIGQSEKFAMKTSLELLEDGYSLLKEGVDSGIRNRLNWLTAARNVAASASMISEIKDKTKKAIALEKELLYRLRYKSLLWPLDGEGDRLSADFYADSPEDYRHFIRSVNKKDPIAIASIVAIYRFASWPAGREDPLPSDLKFTAKEVENMLFCGPRGLGELMRSTLYPNSPELLYHEVDDED